jgi:hypothetical protein
MFILLRARTTVQLWLRSSQESSNLKIGIHTFGDLPAWARGLQTAQQLMKEARR